LTRMMTSICSRAAESLCRALSRFPDRPGDASAGAGQNSASARTAPHTALLDGFDIPLRVTTCSNANTARTDPLCKSTLLESLLNTVTYSVTTSSATDAIGGLLQLWNTANLHNPAERMLSAFVFSWLRPCPVMEQGLTDYGAKRKRALEAEAAPRTTLVERGPRKNWYVSVLRLPSIPETPRCSSSCPSSTAAAPSPRWERAASGPYEAPTRG